MNVRIGVSLVLGFGLGCGACGGGATETPTETTTTAEAEAETTENVPREEAPPAPTLDPSPAPVLRVTMERGEGRLVQVRVQNRGAETVRLRGRVRIERGGELVTEGVGLRADCEAAVPDCVDLAPGGELVPPEWLGTAGDAQCICTRCGPVSGTFVAVVESCAPEGHTPHRVESAPFELPE